MKPVESPVSHGLNIAVTMSIGTATTSVTAEVRSTNRRTYILSIVAAAVTRTPIERLYWLGKTIIIAPFTTECVTGKYFGISPSCNILLFVEFRKKDIILLHSSEDDDDCDPSQASRCLGASEMGMKLRCSSRRYFSSIFDFVWWVLSLYSSRRYKRQERVGEDIGEIIS